MQNVLYIEEGAIEQTVLSKLFEYLLRIVYDAIHSKARQNNNGIMEPAANSPARRMWLQFDFAKGFVNFERMSEQTKFSKRLIEMEYSRWKQYHGLK